MRTFSCSFMILCALTFGVLTSGFEKYFPNGPKTAPKSSESNPTSGEAKGNLNH